MEKNEFHALVEKYKKELMNLAGKQMPKSSHSIITSVNAAEPSNLEGYTGSVYPEDSDSSSPSASNETYEQFISENPQDGYLKIQAFAAQQTIPVSDVNVKISKNFSDGEKVFFQASTDSSGIIDNITLPAPAESISESPSNTIPYSTYDVAADHPNFSVQLPENIQIFSNIKSILPIRLVPNDVK